MTEDQSNVPSISSSGSVFAAYPPNLPVWKKIVKIDSDGHGGFTSEVVQDYTLVKAVEQALLDLADSDDAPEQQQLLMSAWQALAMYLATCDDEDKAAAVNALKMVSNLMSDGPNNGPTPSGTFGTTMQTAAQTNSCPQCSRDFGTQQGLINHLKKLHAGREKQTKATPANDKD